MEINLKFPAFIVTRYPCYLITVILVIVGVIIGITLKHEYDPQFQLRHSSETFWSSLWFSIGSSSSILFLALVNWHGFDSRSEDDIYQHRDFSDVKNMRVILNMEKKARISSVFNSIFSSALFVPDAFLYALKISDIPTVAGISTIEIAIVSLYMLFSLEKDICTNRRELLLLQTTAVLIGISSLTRFYLGLFHSDNIPLTAIYGISTISLILSSMWIVRIIFDQSRSKSYLQRFSCAFMLLILTVASNALFIDRNKSSYRMWDTQSAREFAGYVNIITFFKSVLAIQANYVYRYKSSIVQVREYTIMFNLRTVQIFIFSFNCLNF